MPNQNVIVNTEPTLTPTSVQSTIAKPKLTSYKKGKKVIKGSTLKKAKVVVKIGSKKYTSTASAKGKFSVKLKKPLKKKQVIKIYASKPGFKKSKTAIYKVK